MPVGVCCVFLEKVVVLRVVVSCVVCVGHECSGGAVVLLVQEYNKNTRNTNNTRYKFQDNSINEMKWKEKMGKFRKGPCRHDNLSHDVC